jgi:hypothetical protein
MAMLDKSGNVKAYRSQNRLDLAATAVVFQQSSVSLVYQ